jgi:hypothetical protein
MTPKPYNTSRLDFLWSNFGDKEVINEVSSAPSENTILSEKAVTSLVQ